MTAPASITITPVLVADLLAEGERMPVYVQVIDHPAGRVLVDTGMTELHPGDLDPPLLRPLNTGRNRRIWNSLHYYSNGRVVFPRFNCGDDERGIGKG